MNENEVGNIIVESDAFFEQQEKLGIALAFDDVCVRSGWTEVDPSDVLVEGQFSKRVVLKSPIVSAAMDTVTGAKMAISMAKCGGIGIVHCAMPPDQQARAVSLTKRHLHAVIDRPIFVKPGMTIGELEEQSKQKEYGFESFPVVDENGLLIGLITHNHFDFTLDRGVRICDVMIPLNKVITAPKGTTLQEARDIMHREGKKSLPLVATDGKLAGLYTWTDVKRNLTGDKQSSLHNVDQNGHLRVAAAVSIGDGEMKRVELLVERGVDAIVVETSHAANPKTVRLIQEIKKSFPAIDVVVGNVSSGCDAKRLADAGADGIKVGQGIGSICITSVVTGVGCPQVTAIYECAKALRGYGIPICGDGGIRYGGDVVKALAAGASCVCCGNLLARTVESCGKELVVQGVVSKAYRGMGSIEAMASSKAARERYRVSGTGKDGAVAEGVNGAVPLKGTVSKIVNELVEGVRRGMGLIGAKKIQELQKKTAFVRILSGGLTQAHAHDVMILSDAPNYPSS